MKRLGYLPLALEQAGAFISDIQLQLDEYLPLFEEHRRDLLGRVNAGDICTTRRVTVLTTWELSFKSLERQDHAAAQLMTLLAFLHHETPWEGLFLLAGQGQACQLSPFTVAGDFKWLTDLCADRLRFKNSVGKILSVSLARRGPLPGSLYLHPLVHAWSRDRLNADEQFRKQLHALIVIGQALFYISTLPQTVETWHLKQRLLIHADACLNFTKANDNFNVYGPLFRKSEAVPAILQIPLSTVILGD